MATAGGDIAAGAAAGAGDPEAYAADAMRRIERAALEERLDATERPSFAADFHEFANTFFTGSDAPQHPPVLSGIAALDAHIGGFFVGLVSIIAGRPSMGKSALVKSVVANACVRGEPCLVVSFEEGRREFYSRIMAAEARVENRTVYAGKPSLEERRRIGSAVDPIKTWPLVFVRAEHQTAEQVRLEVKRAKATYPGLRLVAVDHIQRTQQSRADGNRNLEIEATVNALAATAAEFDVAMVVAAQIRRPAPSEKGQRPSLTDLKDSGSLEQTARLVLFPWRPSHGDGAKSVMGERAEIIVGKMNNGSPGTIAVTYDGPYTLWRDRDDGPPAVGHFPTSGATSDPREKEG